MTIDTPRRFRIRFTGLNRAMAVLGLRPANSYVDVDGSRVTVKMGWAFAAVVSRSSVRSVGPDSDRVLGWGVHGWRGRWLVNGSSSNIVRIDIDPPARGKVAGVPVRVTCLRVSVGQPNALVDVLR